MTDVVVIGAGLAGLAAAVRLRALGLAPIVLEATGAAGGVVRSELRDGFLVEAGPNSMAAPSPAVLQLLEEIGIRDRLVLSEAGASKRWIVRGGVPAPVPMLSETTVPRARSDAEESVDAFARRRFGDEAAVYIADSIAAGVFAGDPRRLSFRHAFPRAYAAELAQGSLLRAAAEGGRAAPRVASFPEGMAELPRAMARSLGDRIRLSTPAVAVRRAGGGWSTELRSGETFRSEAVVLAAPSHRLRGLSIECAGIDQLAVALSAVYPPVVTTAFGFRRGDVAHALDGFGLLVPAVERLSLLGVLFSSSLFAGRAPDGQVLLTVFAGGARQPGLARVSRAVLRERILGDIRTLLGVSAAPVFEASTRWPRAIPQYDLEHGRRLAALSRLEQMNAGLHFAGSQRGGVSVGDVLACGMGAADHAARSLARQPA